MTKKEFFNKILETTAEVYSVTTEEIMNNHDINIEWENYV